MNILLEQNAFMPEYAHSCDAGMDLKSPVDCIIPACVNNHIGCLTIDTGIHVAIPQGYVGFLKSKSGLNVKHSIQSTGVIDAGYTGSIVVKLYNFSDIPYVVKRGDKITQLVILPIQHENFTVVDDLGSTERGGNGFGSSGK